MKMTISILLLLIASNDVFTEELGGQYLFDNVSYQESAGWKANTAPDARFIYGEDSAQQFADLRIPSTKAPPGGYPVIVFIHGGAWRSEWSKNYTEAFVEALAAEGFATWDLEFRRIGHRGGGYPGTFEDIADGADHLKSIAKSYILNLDKVIVVGHSSGGHLALWLAGRSQLPESSALYRVEPIDLRGAVSIAGVNDLELSYTLGNRTDVLTLINVDSLESGAPRFEETNPARLLPLGVPQTTMIGDNDSQWRLEMTERYTEQSLEAGDNSKVLIVPEANHMDVVDARSGFAEAVGNEAREFLKR
ncbi:MAG: alpha/beta hydrolase [Gammaproteobacteria bacterium]|nr:alpha/beta hydrolase [Gammaproteobacteria bacterium]MDH3806816.1 alpha/beta hydrolase [Gammaproteobacteria bacterium]